MSEKTKEVVKTEKVVHDGTKMGGTQTKKVRRRRKAGSTTKLYFHSGTQAAIEAYQKETDFKIKNKLYVDEIAPAFEKLTENLINIHKFTSLHDTYDDLKNDCINFLFETLPKFDATRGTNAFSYYNVCAKNFLIIKTKQKVQRAKRSVSLDDPESLSSNESKMIEDFCTMPSQEAQIEQRSSARDIVDVLYEIRSLAKNENELAAINSIITVFENINDLDILTKSGVLFYIRELSGLSPKQLTTSLLTIKRLYRKLRSESDADLTLF